ncbi:aldehyde dehydrogenase family protein [Paracoccus aminophilus]|uniref:aldehyde dehydrogenase (NAD(+)) n=1 Tax=Paracoccus aminophilus JCM 7686 TaxID=1367847 RepID=S5YZJ7_PARAH|nr:aldehyde dehydrogenase family protein [Paracoccus aminophilus]AGT10631.1 aldehyde dehydrogenase [Paracoccus aminophilus JCM 7686]
MGNRDLQFYIDGAWVDPVTPRRFDVIDPATDQAFAQISMGSATDVDLAVAAATRAFASFSRSSRADRIALLHRIAAEYRKRQDDLARAVSREMGAPIWFAQERHVVMGLSHIEKMAEILSWFPFEDPRGASMVTKEAIGVAALITPWNWPLNQVTCKVAPAIGAGCTMILKPAEQSPLSAIIFAEIMEAAGTPPGVFNLVNGDGASVGAALSRHPGVDMVSFTGSTHAGIQVAKAAADTVKRVHQELGGKSANILLPDVDLEDAVTKGVAGCYLNSGQSCVAPSRMFVHRDQYDEALRHAKTAAESYVVGMQDDAATRLGPVASRMQYDKIQGLIESGIAEGARLIAGGPGRPEGRDAGCFVRPTIFADVTPEMRIAREEIFGPVLSILPYDDVDSVIDEANATVYGLAAYVQSKDLALARNVAGRMRAGNIYINYPPVSADMPFGGFKQSGNGRECAEFGLEEFLEIKGIRGYGIVENQ